MQIGWVLLTLVVCVLSAGLTYVLNLANAMCTVPRRLSLPQFVVLAVPWSCGALLVISQLRSAPGESTSVLLWNGLSLLLLLVIAGAGLVAWLAGRPAARRRRQVRREAAEHEAMDRAWQQHGRRERFDLRVEVGIPGRYTDAQGVERNSVEWRVRFAVDGAQRAVTVRSFGAETVDQKELLRQAGRVLDSLEARIAAGWRPDGAILHEEVGAA
jgi:hypothetical protein